MKNDSSTNPDTIPAATALQGNAAELHRVALQIDGFRQQKKLSLPAMCKRYAGLGSDSTLGKCISGRRIDELEIPIWLARYQGVLATLQAERAVTNAEIYADLPHVQTVLDAYKNVINTETSARVILIEGDTGSGKTSCRIALQQTYQDRIVCVEASTVWKDTPGAFLSAILRSLKCKIIPASGADRLNLVIDTLAAKRRTLVIEEAHHLGPRLLNTVKTLVNSTPGEFVLLAMPSLWRRLESAAYEEARQVAGSHRLAARIKIPAIDPSAVAHFIWRRLKLASTDEAPDDALERVIAGMAEKAAKRGNLGFVSRCCERVLAEHKKPIDAGALESALRVELTTR